jgi:hypothetical protein
MRLSMKKWLDSECANEHERIVYFSDQCPMCRVAEILAEVHDPLAELFFDVFGDKSEVDDTPVKKKTGKPKKGKLLKFPKPRPSTVNDAA